MSSLANQQRRCAIGAVKMPLDVANVQNSGDEDISPPILANGAPSIRCSKTPNPTIRPSMPPFGCTPAPHLTLARPRIRSGDCASLLRPDTVTSSIFPSRTDRRIRVVDTLHVAYQRDATVLTATSPSHLRILDAKESPIPPQFEWGGSDTELGFGVLADTSKARLASCRPEDPAILEVRFRVQ